MKKLIILFSFIFLTTALFSGSVLVSGYYRKDGTYVRGHYRSTPDKYKWNNYGPSQTSSELYNYHQRDYDKDRFSNYLDHDDDNDLILDDYDSNQYGTTNSNSSYNSFFNNDNETKNFNLEDTKIKIKKYKSIFDN